MTRIAASKADATPPTVDVLVAPDAGSSLPPVVVFEVAFVVDGGGDVDGPDGPGPRPPAGGVGVGAGVGASVIGSLTVTTKVLPVAVSICDFRAAGAGGVIAAAVGDAASTSVTTTTSMVGAATTVGAAIVLPVAVEIAVAMAAGAALEAPTAVSAAVAVG